MEDIVRKLKQKINIEIKKTIPDPHNEDYHEEQKKNPFTIDREV